MVNYKKFITLLLIFSIHMMPFNSSYASTVGGWTIGGLVADGASAVVNASKTIVVNGANVVKTSTAKIIPSVASVAKVLRGGAAGYALSIAVEQLIGAVDWVLDPANNRVTYFPTADSCVTPQSCPWLPGMYQVNVPGIPISYAPTPSSACARSMTSSYMSANYTFFNYEMLSNGSVRCNYRSTSYPDLRNMDYQISMSYVGNPAYNPNAEQEEQSIPLDVVAAQVITNADSHTDSDKKAGSQVATTTAAQE
jgi:hypothetical protein